MRPIFIAITLLLASGVSGKDVTVPADGSEATRSVAQAFLRRLFVEHDVDGAYADYAQPDFIQHNPNMADGLAGHHAYFDSCPKQANGGPAAWANVNNMLLVDGDLFALHHHVFTGPRDPGRVFVDIFRVQNGKIAEHWDVIQPIPAHMAHHNGMACGKGGDYASARASADTLARPTCGAPDPAARRKASLAVIDAYTKQLKSGDARGAILRWFSPDYRQHSPAIADGIQGAIDYLEHEFGNGAAAAPKAGPSRIIADGDFVLFHRLVTYAGASRPSSNVDIFRVTHGRISEHWDVKQPVPEHAMNKHGMW